MQTVMNQVVIILRCCFRTAEPLTIWLWAIPPHYLCRFLCRHYYFSSLSLIVHNHKFTFPLLLRPPYPEVLTIKYIILGTRKQQPWLPLNTTTVHHCSPQIHPLGPAFWTLQWRGCCALHSRVQAAQGFFQLPANAKEERRDPDQGASILGKYQYIYID